MVLRYSFFRWDGFTTPKYIGLSNYINLFKSDVFLLSVKNTFIYSAVTVSLTIIIGFMLALVIERRIKGWSFFRAAWFLPVIISQTIIGALWSKIYEPSSGLLNTLLRGMGLGFLAQQWLGNPKLALYAVSAVNVLHSSGFAMLLLLVAMEGIPKEIHEAANIDGITPFKRVTHIIFPLIKHTFLIVLMLQIIGALKTFDTIMVLTGGGPGNTTTVFSMLIYRSSFEQYLWGYGSAVSVIMFLLLFFISYAYQKIILKL